MVAGSVSELLHTFTCNLYSVWCLEGETVSVCSHNTKVYRVNEKTGVPSIHSHLNQECH